MSAAFPVVGGLGGQFPVRSVSRIDFALTDFGLTDFAVERGVLLTSSSAPDTAARNVAGLGSGWAP